MVLVLSVFVDNTAWKRISDDVMKALDSKDVGLESVLAGPPLVGMFEIDPAKLRLSQ